MKHNATVKFKDGNEWDWKDLQVYLNVGVECKSNGYLDKTEKEKCAWYLKNKVFSKILMASKGTKRGEIVYKEYHEN